MSVARGRRARGRTAATAHRHRHRATDTGELRHVLTAWFGEPSAG